MPLSRTEIRRTWGPVERQEALESDVDELSDGLNAANAKLRNIFWAVCTLNVTFVVAVIVFLLGLTRGS